PFERSRACSASLEPLRFRARQRVEAVLLWVRARELGDAFGLWLRARERGEAVSLEFRARERGDAVVSPLTGPSLAAQQPGSRRRKAIDGQAHAIRSTTRSLALRARGFSCSSWLSGVIGLRVRMCTPPWSAQARNRHFTMR